MTETTIYQNEKKRKLKKSSLWNIFERDNNGGYEKRALLYLDILSYCVASNGAPVTFWNLAKWLIYERNREFLHYYSGNKSHTNQADRIKEKRDKKVQDRAAVMQLMPPLLKALVVVLLR